MAVAIIPAAGGSRRMGRAKPLLPYGDTTILGSLVSALQRGGVGELILVLRAEDRQLREWASGRDLRQQINPTPENGMLSSIREGLAALGGAASLEARDETLVVCPADHPALRADTIRKLLAAARSRRALLILPTHGGQRGHPLLLHAPLISEIERLDLSAGLRQLLEQRAEAVLEVDVNDPGVLADIDTPEEYQRARNRLDPDSGSA